MAKKSTIEFKKGDGTVHYFQMPIDSWTAGGTLWFAAKPMPDDDVTDARAIIDKSFSDSDIITIGHEMYDPTQATYELGFGPGDITNVSFSDGTKKRSYMGEFQFVPTTGLPETFPGDDFIETIIYADIKRGV